jgi:hypothetical protein
MADAAETPVAEVLAVIGQHAIVILAETRPGAPDDFVGRKFHPRMIDDSYTPAGRESR